MTLINFLANGLSAAGVSHLVTVKSTRRRVVWITALSLTAAGMIWMTYRVLEEYLKYPKALVTEKTSLKELEFPAVTVCGRYLTPRFNAKEAELEYVDEFETFMNALPTYNVSRVAREECLRDPLCWWAKFRDVCYCVKNPCETMLCYSHSKSYCACSNIFCLWNETRGPDACHNIQNGDEKFCVCNKDFEYPFYLNKSTYQETDFSEYFAANISREVEILIKGIKSDLRGDISKVQRFITPNATVLDNYGISFDSLILSCSYGPVKCDIRKDVTTLYSPSFGRCYMINYAGEENVESRGRIKIARHSGRNYGLQLYLQSPKSSMFPLFAKQLSVRVVVHDPRSLPFARERRF
ncbi:uncharacterized protein LOC118200351 isoform X2 [Stegodyphus dumicola]|nr:uncharacterized protein LOC118200351 isoform X2 [Stegodyphus dumicola]XP_035228205.1 uncharacterized protein LOC118200351 isoform X2 [Stegodyphus dumicola]XP_035228206.1 uncharacterized protein LOC118200351 isoform X2 [Stegodyphus dumicola]